MDISEEEQRAMDAFNSSGKNEEDGTTEHLDEAEGSKVEKYRLELIIGHIIFNLKN